MSKEREALKLALEALAASDDFLFNYHDCEPNNEREVDAYSEVRGNNMKAWEAIREALAEQPAQTCDMGAMCLDCQPRGPNGECPDKQPAQQQEPVLWLVNGVVQSSDIPKDYTGCLFTSPPAQQQKPVAWMCCVPGQDAVLLFDEPSDEQYPPGYKQPLGRLSQPAQQKPETVYQCLGAGGYWIDQTKDSYDYNVRHGHATVRVLYTSPPASKPLTDEQIMEMYNEPRSDAEMLEFARAIEAAHGIGKQK